MSSKPTHWWIALHTADPTDAGTGTEVSGGNYARQDLPPGDTNWSAGTATDGRTATLVDVTFPVPNAPWGTVTHFSLWTLVTGGTMKYYGPLTNSRTIGATDPAPKFPAGTLTVTFR